MEQAVPPVEPKASASRVDLTKLLPFLSWAGAVNSSTLRADAVAGITGAIIVLPQAIAFAAIAGLPPEYGLYTAMVTPIVAALFGSSLHLVSGPTTAISIVIFATVSDHAEPGTAEYIKVALSLTFIAGVYQLLFGIFKLGRITNFVSHNVVVGFTTGAAILIAESQLKYVLGVHVPPGHSFIHSIVALWHAAGGSNPYALLIAVVTLIVAIGSKMLWRAAPNLLLALIAGSLTAFFVHAADHGVTMAPAVPARLPPFGSPDLSLGTISDLAPEALAIALLGLIEAVSISRSIASRSHQRIDSDQEFIGQGLSNIVGSFFSSYAGSGSFTRSAANYDAGAKTPMSAIFAAVFLAIIVIFAAPLAAYIPQPAMGAVILVVAYNLLKPLYIAKVVRISKRETSVLLVTLVATLFLDLAFAIFVGVMLSLSLFLMRTSTPQIVSLAPDHTGPIRRMADAEQHGLAECPQLKIVRIDMSIYFGSLDYVQKELNRITDEQGYKHILIIGAGINFIDMAGAEMLVQEAKRLRRIGGGLYFCGVKPSVCDYLKESGFADEFGRDNLFLKKNEAIPIILTRIDQARCASCTARVFTDCAYLPGGSDAGRYVASGELEKAAVPQS
ncbi:MAG: SulP family inorganic anion transporter [Parvularcula sp.]